MNTPTVYVFCGNNCKYEGMTKEQILSAITQAVEDGEITNVDKGFITTVLTVNNVSIKFFYGEQSGYDALTDEQKQNLYPIITNDTFKADVNEAIEELHQAINDTATAAMAAMPLIEEVGLSLTGVSIDDIKGEYSGGIPVANFNRTPVVGDTFSVFGKAKDNISFYMIGEVTKIWASTGVLPATATYKKLYVYVVDNVETATQLAPKEQNAEVNFSSSTNIPLSLLFNKTYLIQVRIDESFTDITFGNSQGNMYSLSFILSIPKSSLLTASYNVPGSTTKDTIFGNIYSNVVSISDISTLYPNADFKIEAIYADGTWTIKLKVRKSSESSWANYIEGGNSLKPTVISCYELF